MSDSKPSLQDEITALRSANMGLRQKVREQDAQLLRQQLQSQEALAHAEGTIVELRYALASRLKIEADLADEVAAKGRPKPAEPAGQVGGAPPQG